VRNSAATPPDIDAQCTAVRSFIVPDQVKHLI